MLNALVEGPPIIDDGPSTVDGEMQLFIYWCQAQKRLHSYWIFTGWRRHNTWTNYDLGIHATFTSVAIRYSKESERAWCTTCEKRLDAGASIGKESKVPSVPPPPPRTSLDVISPRECITILCFHRFISPNQMWIVDIVKRVNKMLYFSNSPVINYRQSAASQNKTSFPPPSLLAHLLKSYTYFTQSSI